jgi:hypothetical protein
MRAIRVNHGMAGGMKIERFAVYRDATGTVHLPMWNNEQRLADAMVIAWENLFRYVEDFIVLDQLQAQAWVQPGAPRDATDVTDSDLSTASHRSSRQLSISCHLPGTLHSVRNRPGSADTWRPPIHCSVARFGEMRSHSDE